MLCEGIVKLAFPALDVEIERIERDQVYPSVPMILDDLRDIERLARTQRWRSAVRLAARYKGVAHAHSYQLIHNNKRMKR